PTFEVHALQEREELLGTTFFQILVEGIEPRSVLSPVRTHVQDKVATVLHAGLYGMIVVGSHDDVQVVRDRPPRAVLYLKHNGLARYERFQIVGRGTVAGP